MKKHAERNGQSRRKLSEQQQAAVELLAAGKTDKEAASALNLPGDSVDGAGPVRPH
jgi:DNA-binding NarL/FixJ family response regulator